MSGLELNELALQYFSTAAEQATPRPQRFLDAIAPLRGLFFLSLAALFFFFSVSACFTEAAFGVAFGPAGAAARAR